MRTITKPVALCAHSGYKASFEACLVNLGGLEKHNFQQRCWKTAESVSVKSHKVSPLRPVFGLAVVVPPAVSNDFKLVIVAVTTKLMVTTGN